MRLLLNGGVLQADRLEFDSDFNSLLPEAASAIARRSVFPGQHVAFSLVHRNGAMEDVYGVLDLDSAAADFNPFPSNPLAGDTSRRDSVNPRSQNPARIPRRCCRSSKAPGLGSPHRSTSSWNPVQPIGSVPRGQCQLLGSRASHARNEMGGPRQAC